MGGPPPQKQGPSVAMIVLIVLIAFFVIGGGGCLVCVCAVSSSSDHNQSEKRNARNVGIRDILTAYRFDVARGDRLYKGKWLTIRGARVSEVNSSSYFTVNSGKSFEFPELRCYLAPDQIGRASSLGRGSRVTLRGKGGGMAVHVLLNECEIL